MKRLNATIIGATGLIGSHLLEVLQSHDGFEKIKVLSRRPLEIDNKKTSVQVIDFDDEKSFRKGIEGTDVVFCAVGTTMKKVNGNKDAYRKVDFHIPETAAKLCNQVGCDRFVIVSAIGASSGSRNFYLKLKGEAEKAVCAQKLESVSIFRPSLLLGKRKEFRLAEKIAAIVMPVVSFLVPSNYKPVKAKDVARAMLAATLANKKGCHVFHFKEIMQLSLS